MRQITAVTVVYNVFCRESETCQALMQMKDKSLDVLIFDNSTKDYGNRQFCEEQGWGYLGGTGNRGLSAAYNACIDYIKNEAKDCLVCLFDDDTKISEDYFDMLQQVAAKSDAGIFVPLIYSRDSLMSPCLLKPGYRISRFENAKTALDYSGSYLTAINSCMAVELSLFEKYRYDEHIFLDGIDHCFIKDMKQRGVVIKVFPYRCEHAFSGDERPPKKSALFRFSLFKKDFDYILRNDRKAYYFLVGKRALNLTMQYRTLEFLKAMFKK